MCHQNLLVDSQLISLVVTNEVVSNKSALPNCQANVFHIFIKMAQSSSSHLISLDNNNKLDKHMWVINVILGKSQQRYYDQLSINHLVNTQWGDQYFAKSV